jgi:hypothetical protein
MIFRANRLNVLVAPIRSLRSSVLQNVLSLLTAFGFCWLKFPVIGSTPSHLWFERSSNVIQALVKFSRVLNTPMSLNIDWSVFVELPCLFWKIGWAVIDSRSKIEDTRKVCATITSFETVFSKDRRRSFLEIWIFVCFHVDHMIYFIYIPDFHGCGSL